MTSRPIRRPSDAADPVDALLGAQASRRRFLLGAAGAAVAATLAACGSDDDGGSTGASGGSGTGTTAAAGGAFPVTVRDRFGTTTVESEPRRVVCYGYNDHDTMLALGVVPVGFIKWIPEWTRGCGPWSLDALGDARPELFNGEELPFERIAALRPDLILAVNHNLRDADHERLAQIAPIVSTPAGYENYSLPPDIQALQVGTALGRRAEVQRLLDRLDGLYASARRAHPEFAGKTVMTVTPTEGQMSIFADTDTRGLLVRNLGFRQPAEVRELVGDDFYAYLSPEKFGILDVDALIVLAYNRASADALRKMPTYQNLDVVRRGGAVVVDDLDTAMGLAAGTVTSVPWALDRLVPGLAEAIAKA